MPRRRPKSNHTEHRMVRSLDELTEFEQYKELYLKSIRDDLAAGKTAEEIQKKYSALAAARIASIALTDADPTKAITAAKDILDRTQGRAKETTEISLKYEDLSDDELDSLLLSKFKPEEEKDQAN